MTEEQTIYQRLQKVQAELKAPKNETGRFGAHRSAEGILAAVKPLLERHELVLVLTDDVIQIGNRNYVHAQATIADAKGNTVHATANAWEGEVSRGLDSSQVTGMASSYARKYALGGLFAIDDTKDADSKAYDDASRQAGRGTARATEASERPATPAQKAQITSLLRGAHVSDDHFETTVQTAYGQSLKALTYDDAVLLIGKLKAKPVNGGGVTA